MEKYTKESLAKMTPEELENVVLKLQDELEAEKITSKHILLGGIRKQKDVEGTLKS